MKRIVLFVLALLVSVNVYGQRIAYTCDGNYHDRDDWGASPMGLALLADAGQGWRLVHYDYNNHFPQSSSTWERQMTTSVDIGMNYGIFCPTYNCRVDRTGAITSLRREIQASNENNRLTILLAGPAEILWQALQGVPNSTRKYVTVVSHSSNYNENSGPHTLAQCTGVVVNKIPNQNQRLNTKQNWSPWTWLRNTRYWQVYDRMRASGRADVSDSGMIYYVLYGKSTPTISDYRAKLSN